MFATLFTATVLSVVAIQGALAGLAVNTPTLTQCGSTMITWANTAGPFDIVVASAADPCGDPIVDLGSFTGTTFSWQAVNISANTDVLISVVDATGEEAWSGQITVGPSSDSSCLPGASSSSSVAQTTPSVPTPPTKANTATTSPTVSAVGAVNAGSNPLSSGALSSFAVYTPTLFLGAVAAVFAVSC